MYSYKNLINNFIKFILLLNSSATKFYVYTILNINRTLTIFHVLYDIFTLVWHKAKHVQKPLHILQSHQFSFNFHCDFMYYLRAVTDMTNDHHIKKLDFIINDKIGISKISLNLFFVRGLYIEFYLLLK